MEIIHQNEWFKVGLKEGYYSIEHTDRQVMILPVLDHSKVIMVRVKRPLLNDETLELPAGGCHSHETLQEGAARELREETGIFIPELCRFQEQAQLAILPRMPDMPYNFKIDLTYDEWQNRDHFDSEISEVVLFTFEEVKKAIIDGDIYVSQSIAILARYLFSEANS